MKERSKSESNTWKFTFRIKIVGEFILPVSQSPLSIGDVVTFDGKIYKVTDRWFYISKVNYNEWEYFVEEVK